MTRSATNELRAQYHSRICESILGVRAGGKGFSNADSSSEVSRTLANGIAKRIGNTFCPSVPTGQAAGALFASVTKDYLESAFKLINHVRPGEWLFTTSQGRVGIAAYDQYEHLSRLSDLAAAHPEVRQILGGDYLITPDIIVGKAPLADSVLNANIRVVSDDEDGIAERTPLRASNEASMTLHASISCKWTIRSDRAQNTRTEALNLLRNRKGRVPHIIVVTAEPLPSRLASIALGTGDVDCTYHMALPELVAATQELPIDTGDYIRDEVSALLDSRRLRDISDLPFDLAI